MTPEYARTMARYNRWMNEKLYAVAEKLGDAERKKDCGAFFRSIHGTLNHLLLADRVWLGRFAGTPVASDEIGPGIKTLDQELYADFDELRRERAKTDAEIEAWVSQLMAGKLAGDLRFSRRGATSTVPRWQALAHLFNHQTHHRGQVTTLLMQAGVDPGVTDLVAMLRDTSIQRELVEARRNAKRKTRILRFEDVDPPRVRFLVKQRIDRDDGFESLSIDAAFAFRVLIDAFAVMANASFALEDQPIDAAEARRRIEKHPAAAIYLPSMTEPFLSSAGHTAALAADFVSELHVARPTPPIAKIEDGHYQLATVSLHLRLGDLAFHCVPGFQWSSTMPEPV